MSGNVLQAENLYKAPEAELIDASVSEGKALYVVSKKKMALLFILTLGIYEVYWFYENWNRIRKATGKSMLPFLRGIFSIFFAHSLFKHIQTSAEEKNIKISWSYMTSGTIYVGIYIVSTVADNMSDIVGLLSFLLMPVTLCILMEVQSTINATQGDPKGDTNSRFTIANYLWAIVGLLLWALVIFAYAESFGFISIDDFV